MFDKIFFKEYIFSYNRVCNILATLCDKYKGKILCECIGKTNFCYNINSYNIGYGKKDVILIGATHSNEIVTVYFLIEFMINILYVYDKIGDILKEYTFHFIPILNVDGYIITSSNIVTNFETFSKSEIELLSKKYFEAYEKDDKIAKLGIKKEKSFYDILKASTKNIEDLRLRKSVQNILKCTKLDSRVLNIWSANGLGVDQNSNSIHKFCEIKKLRKKQKFANLRYNDIPVTMPSPMSYPGNYTFDRSPENKSLFDYITRFYLQGNLKFIFSYHSTGGEIYGIPFSSLCNKEKLKKYTSSIDMYSKISGYTKMDDKYKYGVMDYYREVLDGTICLTIELSKENANPIGPFKDIFSLENEIVLNKKAVMSLLKFIC